MMGTKEDQNKKTEKTASTSGTQATVVIDTDKCPSLYVWTAKNKQLQVQRKTVLFQRGLQTGNLEANN